jgi:cytoskeleton protein RodZ
MTEQNDAGDGVGADLARARATLGYSVADVAQQLKFAARQIEALEQGRYEELPTGTFARGMVRAYARLVRLDPEPLVQRVAARVAAPSNVAVAASVRRPIPITDNARRTNLMYAALSVVLLLVIVGVAFEWQRERAGTDRMTFVPAAAQVSTPAPEPQRVAAAAPGLGPLQASEAPAAAADAKQPVPAAQAAAPAPGKRRIQMRFDRESWVEIRGADGKVLTSELNRGGTERTVDGNPPFDLVIGNAHHVKLSYDDRPIDLASHIKVEVARFRLD